MDSYGLSAEDLKIRMQVMAEDLKDFDLRDIDAAFIAWRRDNEKIPTPKNMRKLCYQKQSERLKKKPFTKPNVSYVQIVRRKADDYNGSVLAEYDHGQHKNPIELEHIHGPVNIAYKRAEE